MLVNLLGKRRDDKNHHSMKFIVMLAIDLILSLISVLKKSLYSFIHKFYAVFSFIWGVYIDPI